MQQVATNKKYEPVALGCSHTAGTGVEIDQCYVSVLSRMINKNIKNLAIGGGNASTNQDLLVKLLRYNQPKFVIAQWPNPIRLTLWSGEVSRLENINSCSAAFKELLKQSQENFYQPWLQAIITCDLLCKQKNIPILHILLENIQPKYNQILVANDITLHVDEKLPGKTWLFDSGGKDKVHHSAYCHNQWAERICGLLNEIT